MTFINLMYRYRCYFFLFFIIIFTYASSFYSGPLWDDFVFIFENDQITKNGNPFIFFNPFIKDHRAWPLGYTFFWFIYKAFGENWILYKLLNIILHFINTILIFNLLRVNRYKYALAVTTLFAIHPLHIETVSWIFQFNTMISTTFLLIAFIYWFKVQCGKSFKNYYICLLFFSFSLMTKSYAIFVPIFFWATSTTRFNLKKRFFLIIPLLIASLLGGLSTIRGVTSSALENQKQINYQILPGEQTQKLASKNLSSTRVLDPPPVKIQSIEPKTDSLKSNAQDNTDAIKQENNVDILKKTEEAVNRIIESDSNNSTGIESQIVIDSLKSNWFNLIIERYITISNSFGFYFTSFFAINDRFLFQPPFDQSHLLINILNLFIFTSFIILIFLISTKLSKRLQRIKLSIILLISLFIPISGIVYIPFMKYSPVSDHWFYFSVMPLCYLLIECISYIYEKFTLRKYFRNLQLLFAIPFVFFAIESFKYGSLFNDHETLFLRNIDAYPHNVFLYRYLAQYYENQGDKKNSKLIIEQGLMLHPTDIGLIIDWQRIIK